MPLEDGTWVMFTDRLPHLPAVPSFPVPSIILVELFFVAISMLAFWLIARPLRRLAEAADKLGRHSTACSAASGILLLIVKALWPQFPTICAHR